MSMGSIEQLTHSTVRIECALGNGGIATGTGFFMEFLRNKEQYIPVIITNKHVVKGAKVGKFHVTRVKDDGTPDLINHKVYEIDDFESKCIPHPDPNVDLTAFPMGPLLNQALAEGVKLFIVSIPMDFIAKGLERKGLSPMEDIIMIGYPNGIWDSIHNKPVIRKGITATHPDIPWNGKKEFLTDIASFPGSSGSPVFLANIGSYTDSVGNIHMGQTRIKLLGIHYAGALHTASGTIQIVTAPTSNLPVPITQIPNNIGVAVNSTELTYLESEVRVKLGIKW